MPNVRASSGMIGTTRLPNPGSRMRFRRSFANTIVVLTAVAEPAANSRSVSGAGAGRGRPRTIRFGSPPPSARRRSIR